MKKKILMITGWQDLPTTTSLFLVNDILAYANTFPKEKYDIDYIFPPFGYRPMFWLRIKLEKYDAIFYVGHGTEDKLYGQTMFSGLINTRNVNTLKDKIVVTMACDSAKILGREAIKQGCRAYIGANDLVWAHFNEKDYPYLDRWREEFGSYFKSVLDGNTVKESIGKFYRIITNHIKFYEEHYRQRKTNGRLVYKNMDWYLKSAMKNKQVMVVLGDPDAKL